MRCWTILRRGPIHTEDRRAMPTPSIQHLFGWNHSFDARTFTSRATKMCSWDAKNAKSTWWRVVQHTESVVHFHRRYVVEAWMRHFRHFVQCQLKTVALTKRRRVVLRVPQTLSTASDIPTVKCVSRREPHQPMSNFWSVSVCFSFAPGSWLRDFLQWIGWWMHHVVRHSFIFIYDFMWHIIHSALPMAFTESDSTEKEKARRAFAVSK